MTSRIAMDSHIIESVKKVGTLLRLRGPANLQGILDESGNVGIPASKIFRMLQQN